MVRTSKEVFLDVLYTLQVSLSKVYILGVTEKGA